MKKVFLFLSFPVLVLTLSGCATEFNVATGRQETLMYGTDKEIKIGEAVSRQMDEHYQIAKELDVNERVNRILGRLEPVLDRRDLVYFVKVIDEDKVNAVSLPGGYVYVFKGLIDKVDSDDQLAGVIAHELGHITAKHGLKRMQNSYGYTVLQALAISSGNAEVAQGVNAVYTTLFFAFSQKDEFEADRLAVRYTQQAGYDPSGMLKVLELLQKEDRKSLKRVSYFRTHPYINERMAALRQEITGEMSFEDYLNLTGSDPR